MALTLNNSINFAQAFIEYSPLTAGLGLEPAITVASVIRNSILAPGNVWYWNRNEISFPTIVGQQDYTQSISANGNDFSFIEKATLTDDAGNIYEMKDVYNTSPLAVSAFQQRPNAIAAQQVFFTSGTQNVKFRFLGVPDKIYTVTVTYQKRSAQFGPFFISSVAANGAYTGVFDSFSFPAGVNATITGFQNAGNNGTFVVSSCTPTLLTVSNGSSAAETRQGFVSNLSWDPIPDAYSDIYNNLFLSEALAVNDDARAQIYRQRGVAAFMAKATGLSETQKNIFAQQWLARDAERMSLLGRTQLANTGRGV